MNSVIVTTAFPLLTFSHKRREIKNPHKIPYTNGCNNYNAIMHVLEISMYSEVHCVSSLSLQSSPFNWRFSGLFFFCFLPLLLAFKVDGIRILSEKSVLFSLFRSFFVGWLVAHIWFISHVACVSGGFMLSSIIAISALQTKEFVSTACSRQWQHDSHCFSQLEILLRFYRIETSYFWNFAILFLVENCYFYEE